jgi:hypothetical protein
MARFLKKIPKPSTKTETIPNLNALLNAYQEGQHIPSGVKIQQDYNIRRARILVKRSVELSPSAYPSEFLPEPNPTTDLDDAHILCRCHEQAIADFQLQIEMIELELTMLTDDGDMLPYNESKAQELEERKLKLMTGKRFQTNARNAYWYYLMKAKN